MISNTGYYTRRFIKQLLFVILPRFLLEYLRHLSSEAEVLKTTISGELKDYVHVNNYCVQ